MPTSHLELADYRKRVFDIYRHVRDSQDDPESGWRYFRSAQDKLFKLHPQTALTPEQVASFSSLEYYPYNPALRFVLPVEPVDEKKSNQDYATGRWSYPAAGIWSHFFPR